MTGNIQRRISIILLMMLIFVMVLRKTGFGFSSILLNLTISALCFVIVRWTIFFERISSRIITSVFLIICLCLLQYWISNHNININENWQVSSNTLLLMAWMIFSILVFREIINNGITLTLWLFISLILSTTIFLNPREFHKFYRHSTYEEFIRKKYPEQKQLIADYFIDKYKTIDKAKADEYFENAVDAEDRKKYTEALSWYNKSIEENPDNKVAYHRRGFLKLTKLDINEDVALSAYKDFCRVIRLDPGYTIAYFHRGVVFGYLGDKSLAARDFRSVWNADSILSADEFQKKYGMSKESFSVPFHP